MVETLGPFPVTEKDLLRARLLTARRQRSPQELERARAAITEHVVERCVDQGWPIIAAYQPLRSEPGSTDLLATLDELEAQVMVPLVLPDLDLDWDVWTPDNVATEFAPPGSVPRRADPPVPLWDEPAYETAWPETPGNRAVASAAAWLVPALAVDRRGSRLGRGGGSYDRALRRRKSTAPVIAVLFDDEVLPAVPTDRWDEPVTHAVTPSGFISFPESPSWAGLAE